MASILPSPADVRDAAARLSGLVVHTPLIPSPGLSAIAGGEVMLKLESEQTGGSFKLRGALNALLMLPEAVRAKGVIAASAGNHGIGIAIAAERLGIAATVYVPATAPKVKRDKIAQHGARVDATQPNYDAAEAEARRAAARSGATYVSPCTGRTLLAGAGTIAKEILDDAPNVATIILGVGGAGLAGGVGGYVRGTAAAVRIFGAQAKHTNAMTLALKSGKPTDIPDLPTLADGLAGLVDAEMLQQAEAALDGIVTVDEEAIASAVAWLHRAHDLHIEGSGAVGVAAIRTGVLKPRAFPAAIVLSGRNIDDEKWRNILDTHGKDA